MAVVTLTDQINFIERVFGTGRLSRNSRNFDVRCPICDPADRNKKKLSILLPESCLHCWVCGFRARSLVPLIYKYGTRQQLIEYRDKFMVEPARFRRCLDLAITAPDPGVLTLPADFTLLATSVSRDPDVLALRRYLLNRNVSARDLWYYKIGYSNEFRWRRRALVPSFDVAGTLNCFVGRTIDNNRRPKYDVPDIERLDVIFNEINLDWSQELVVVEGAFDLMKCPDNAVPLLGSDLNEQSALFNNIVAHNTPVALALDADMKLKKTPRIARKLAEYGIDVRVVRVADDPGSTTKQQFKQLLADAKFYDWHDEFLDRLDAATQVRL